MVYNNTVTGTTRHAAKMIQWREYYDMITLYIGDILACGGNMGNLLSSCELYTPANNTWTAYPSLPVATMDLAMINLARSQLDCGRPFVFGGSTGYALYLTTTGSVYIFIGNTWRTRTPMPVALANHRVVQLDHTTALACGGYDNSEKIQSACYSYNATADEWSLMPPLNRARGGHGMTVYNGAITDGRLHILLLQATFGRMAATVNPMICRRSSILV
jgi:hypothetical protein